MIYYWVKKQQDTFQSQISWLSKRKTWTFSEKLSKNFITEVKEKLDKENI